MNQQLGHKTVSIDIAKSHEPWGEIQLADGHIIKTRLVIVSVARMIDDKGKMIADPDGLPMYVVNHRVIMAPQPKE